MCSCEYYKCVAINNVVISLRLYFVLSTIHTYYHIIIILCRGNTLLLLRDVYNTHVSDLMGLID